MKPTSITPPPPLTPRKIDKEDPYPEFTVVLTKWFMTVHANNTFNGEYSNDESVDGCEPYNDSADPNLRTWCLNLNLDNNPLNLVGDPKWYSFDNDTNQYVFNYYLIRNLYTECLTTHGILPFTTTWSRLSIHHAKVRSICENEVQLLQILKFLNTERLMNFLEDNKLGGDSGVYKTMLLPPLFMKVYNKTHARFEKCKEKALKLRKALLQQQDRWLMGYQSYSRNAVLYIDMHGAYGENFGTIDETPPPSPLGQTFTHIHLTIPSKVTYCNSVSHLAAKDFMQKWDWEKQWVQEKDKVTALQYLSKAYTSMYINQLKAYASMYINQLPERSHRDQYRMGTVRWYDMQNDAVARLMNKVFSVALDLKNVKASANGIFFVNEFTGEQRRMFIRTPTISETRIANWGFFFLEDLLTYFYGLGFANVVLLDITCNTVYDTNRKQLEGRDARHFYTSFVLSNSVEHSSLSSEDMNDNFNGAQTMLPEHHGQTWFAFRSERQLASLASSSSSSSLPLMMKFYRDASVDEVSVYKLLSMLHTDVLKNFRAANNDKLTPPMLAVLDQVVETHQSIRKSNKSRKGNKKRSINTPPRLRRRAAKRSSSSRAPPQRRAKRVQRGESRRRTIRQKKKIHTDASKQRKLY